MSTTMDAYHSSAERNCCHIGVNILLEKEYLMSYVVIGLRYIQLRYTIIVAFCQSNLSWYIFEINLYKFNSYLYR